MTVGWSLTLRIGLVGLLIFGCSAGAVERASFSRRCGEHGNGSAGDPASLEKYRRVELRLDSDKPAVFEKSYEVLTLPSILHLGYEPGKTPRQFWFSRPRLDITPIGPAGLAGGTSSCGPSPDNRHLVALCIQERHRDFSRLTCSADGVKGTIGLTFLSAERGGQWVTGTLELDVTLEGDVAKGTFTRTVNTRHLAASLGRGEGRPVEGGDGRWATKETVETGTVTGAVHRGVDLAQRHAIAPGKDITSLNASVQVDGYPPYDGKVIEELADAQLAWVSEASTPLAWRDNFINHGGSYTPPILWKGRLYLYYLQPKPGKAQDKPYSGKEVGGITSGSEPTKEAGARNAKQWMVREAQEVVLCMDAATGLTIWKRVIDFEGARNWHFGFSKDGPYQIPCIDNGRLFVQGSVGQLYCLDAMTGKTIWEDGVVRFDECLDHTLLCMDGVLLALTPGGFGGFDAATGKPLWSQKEEDYIGPDVGGEMSFSIQAAPWHHEGKAYFLDHHGLHDVKTGKRLWDFPREDKQPMMLFPFVDGDVTFWRVKGPVKAKKGYKTPLTAFRISPEGYEQLWEHPAEVGIHSLTHVCVSGGYVFGTSSYPKSRWVKGYVFNELASGGKKCNATDMKTGELFWLDAPRAAVLAAVHKNGLIIGKGSGIFRLLSEPPYWQYLGNMGYWQNNCMQPIYSDGRWFKRTDFGHLVCVDLRYSKGRRGAPIAEMFAAVRTHLAQGSGTRLSWKALRAETVRVEPEVGVVESEGQIEVRPAQTTTYTLTVEGNAMQDTKTVEVFVHPLGKALKKAGGTPGLAARFYAHEGGGLPKDRSALKLIRDGVVADRLTIKPGTPPKKSPEPPKSPRKVRPAVRVPVLDLDDIDTAAEVDAIGELEDTTTDKSAAINRKSWTMEPPTFGIEGRMTCEYTGYIEAPADGLYAFNLSAAGAAALHINRRIIAETPGVRIKFGHMPPLKVAGPVTGWVALAKGPHRFKLQFQRLDPFQSALDLTWRPPDAAEDAPIPPERLSH